MKIVKEHINEKFIENSDPVHDLGIGIYGKHNFSTKNELINWIWKVLPIILGGSIPKNIIFVKEDYWFNDENIFSKIDAYVKNHVRLNGKQIVCDWHFYNAIHNALMREGYRVKRRDKTKFKSSTYEDKPDMKIDN